MLGTQDLDSSIEFATNIAELQLLSRRRCAPTSRSDKAEVRGDTRDHTPAYFEGDLSDQTIELELIDSADLDAVGAALEKAGRPVHFGTREECDNRHTQAFIASSDPSGNKLRYWRGHITVARDSFRYATCGSPISATSLCSVPPQ
jgi:2,3-dihydroxy-p-cumate/2,3-dihydroxybenzoate 3,4-dioxygenase